MPTEPTNHVAPYFGRQAIMTYDSSHDTFVWSNHKNFLVNNAGVGTFAHGRIHQEFGYSIYVSDLIHKRGVLMSDDILLMEEQVLQSMVEPLSTPSQMGDLVAMAMLPTMQTANGEGDLIAYYENGVVAFDTGKGPRETRHDGDGVMTQKGWDTMRLVNHLLNKVSAVSRYAVAVLTRDHFFRSRYGLHFLKTVLGEGTFNSENVNRISQDVDPILSADTDLSGAACGFWPSGHRMFDTTGLITDESFSSSGMGRGFVSWNQAVTYTEDRTPIPTWEGLWVVDKGVKGIHKFVQLREFGFVCSDTERNLFLVEIDETLDDDFREKAIPISWSFETGRFAPNGLTAKSFISGLSVEAVVSNPFSVYIRTDQQGEWVLWKTVKLPEKSVKNGESLLMSESLGEPPQAYRECTWVQVRVEGLGYCEPRTLDLDFSTSTAKSGRSSSKVTTFKEKDLWP